MTAALRFRVAWSVVLAAGGCGPGRVVDAPTSASPDAAVSDRASDRLVIAVDDSTPRLPFGRGTALSFTLQAPVGSRVRLTGRSDPGAVAVHFETLEGVRLSEVEVSDEAPAELVVVLTPILEERGPRVVVPAPINDVAVELEADSTGEIAVTSLQVSTGPLFYLRLMYNEDEPMRPLFPFREVEMKTGTVLMIENPGTAHGLHSDGGPPFPHMSGLFLKEFADGMAWNPPTNALYAPDADVSTAEPFDEALEQFFYCHEHGSDAHGGGATVFVTKP